MKEKGTISIHTENIFPIIKKFLYSDNEIFLRELVSNAADATQKIKRLASLGQYNGELGELKVEVAFDEQAKTITISDNGLGMTAEEIKKYINQIAFSGATEFVEKFKDAKDANEIIGKFGLGFYSAFMVSDLVEINTLSYQDGAEPAAWVCDGSTEFEIKEGTRITRGTDIILHVNKESEDFLNQQKLQTILDKYFKFLPVTLVFGTETESIEDGEDAEGNIIIRTAFNEFGNMNKALEEKGIEVITAELTRIPANTVELGEDEANEVLKMVDKLEQDEDVQKVYHNLK